MGSSFKFFLQLIQEAPIGALGDELLRVGLDQSDLMQPQSVEAQSVFGFDVRQRA